MLTERTAWTAPCPDPKVLDSSCAAITFSSVLTLLASCIAVSNRSRYRQAHHICSATSDARYMCGKLPALPRRALPHRNLMRSYCSRDICEKDRGMGWTNLEPRAW